MNEIRIFDNPEFGEVRTVMIDGEPWFVAKDISQTLGYAKTFSMMRRVDDEDKRNISSSNLEEQGAEQPYTIGIVNESGLYAAVFGSKLESAKKFKRWVTSEVLPALRKTGTYELEQNPLKLLEVHYEAIKQVNQKVETLEERVDKIELDLPILPIEADRITVAARRKGVAVLGGKKSAAYKDRGLRQKVYSNLYANLKYNFGVRSYKAIKRSQCDRAVEIIGRYEPPVFLADQIVASNAQMNLTEI